MKNLLKLFAIIGVFSACESNLPRKSNLEKPRVLAISADRPVFLPGQSATARILIHDPLWRKPTIHWVIGLNPDPREFVAAEFGDPTTLSAEETGYQYLGEGAQVVIPPLPIPDQLINIAVNNFLELLPFPLFAYVELPGEEPLFSFKQMQVQVTQATDAFLATQEDYIALSASDQRARREERYRLVFNANPILGPLSVSSTNDELAVEDFNDLVLRKALAMEVSSNTVGPFGTIRASLPLTDTDNTVLGRELKREDTGYNLLQVDGYIEFARRLNISRTTVDFVFTSFEQDSAFDELAFLPMDAGMYFAALVAIDRRGGVDWRTLTADVNTPKPDQLDNAALLVRDNFHSFWVQGTADVLSAVEAATEQTRIEGIVSLLPVDQETAGSGPIGFPVYLDDIKVAPLPTTIPAFAGGATAVTDTAGPVTGPPQGFVPPQASVSSMADLAQNLILLHDSVGTKVTITVEYIRPAVP